MLEANYWSIHELAPVVDLLYLYVDEPSAIRLLAERAGCPRGKLRKLDDSRQQWENVIIFAIGDGRFEALVDQAHSELPDDWGERFTESMKTVCGRRLVGLLGDEYNKLRAVIDNFLDEENQDRQIEFAAGLRRMAISLYREFNNDLSWQAMTLMKTSTIEIRSMRQRFRVLSINVVTAAEYLLAIARPFGTSNEGTESTTDRLRLASRPRGYSRLDEDEQIRRIEDARMTLFIEADQLWNSLKDSVALPRAT